MAEAGTAGHTVVDHVGLTVTDLDAAIAWYGDGLRAGGAAGAGRDRRGRGARAGHLRA